MGLSDPVISHCGPEVAAQGGDEGLGCAIFALHGKIAAQGGGVVLGCPDVPEVLHDPAAFALAFISGQVVRQRDGATDVAQFMKQAALLGDTEIEKAQSNG
jgi:hypothetical protein